MRPVPSAVTAVFAAGCVGTVAAQPTPCPANLRWTPARVEVFAATNTLVAAPSVATVYYLDALQQVTAELNAGAALVPDHRMAVATIRQRLQAMGPAFRRRIEAALRAAEAFTVYGLQSAPAIVFDRSCVVYGLADVPRAMDVVRRGGGQTISPPFVPGRPVVGQLPSAAAARTPP